MEDSSSTRVGRALKTFTPPIVAEAVHLAGLQALDPIAAGQLSEYGNLLLKWNARINLTSIREPFAILDRHIVESVAAAQRVPTGVSTLLDFGSGAGLPGVPIAICRPEIQVTLAESQTKKAAFLAEVRRTTLVTFQLHNGRVDALAGAEQFDAVTLRAVDRMHQAVREARKRVRPGGYLVVFSTKGTQAGLLGAAGTAIYEEHVLNGWSNLLICKA